LMVLGFASYPGCQLVIGRINFLVEQPSSCWINSHFCYFFWHMYHCPVEDDAHKLGKFSVHSEELGSKIWRPSSGSTTCIS
jgi:hypothetical protein